MQKQNKTKRGGWTFFCCYCCHNRDDVNDNEYAVNYEEQKNYK